MHSPEKFVCVSLCQQVTEPEQNIQRSLFNRFCNEGERMSFSAGLRSCLLKAKMLQTEWKSLKKAGKLHRKHAVFVGYEQSVSNIVKQSVVTLL